MELTPTRIALYTNPRKRDVDFEWYPESIDSSLFDTMKTAHHDLMVKFDPEDTPQIAVLIQPDQIAFLICNLSGNESNRRLDHYNRLIKHSLYLEFDNADRKTVLSGIAALLQDEKTYREYFERFYAYADQQYEPVALQHKQPELTRIDWPKLTISKQSAANLKDDLQIATPLNADTRREYAGFLMRLAQQEQIERDVLLVATGRVKFQEIEMYATKNISKKQEFIVLTLSSSVKNKQKLSTLILAANPQQRATRTQRVQTTATQILQAGQAVMTQVVQPVVPYVQPVISYVRNAFLGNPPAIDQQETQPKTASDSQEEKSTDAKNSSLSMGEQITAGVWALFAIGSLFFIDIIPPQLASLMLQSSNLMQAAQTPLPRFGDFGKAQLTFSDSVQGVKLSNQACEKADDTAKTWECAVGLSSENPNQVETLTLAIADVKDDAGNVMPAKTVTAQIESADIRAELFDASRTILKDGAPFAVIQVKASAKYGVKAVTMLGVPAAQTQTPEVWQAEIPLASAPKMPLTAVILDKHDNELRVQLP